MSKQDSPDLEHLFSLLVMMTGAGVFTYGITNMCSLVYNLNRGELVFREKMDSLNEFLLQKKMPPELSARIRDYYEYLQVSIKRFFATVIMILVTGRDGCSGLDSDPWL